MPSRQQAATSRRSEASINEDEDFLDQLNCLNSGRRSSESSQTHQDRRRGCRTGNAVTLIRQTPGSHSSRHTWRSGLIPPCLEPPYRIPSNFPVPHGTLSQVPGLSHPELSRGQRRYLHSTAQIYSMDSTKRALSNSYYGLLMNELLRGGGGQDSLKRYTGWIYGTHKRLFETNPAIWRSPRKSRKNSQEEVNRHSDEQGETRGRGRGDVIDSTVTAPEKRPVSAKPRQSPSSPEIECQNLRRQQSGRQRPSTVSGKDTTVCSDDEDANNISEQIIARPAARPRQSARGSRTSVRTASSARGPRNGAAASAAPPDDDGTDEESVDNQRPRDLNKIMY